MQSGVSPLLVQKTQIAFGLNLSLRGGFITHRPPIQLKNLDFGGNTALLNLVQKGFFQGAGYYRPDYGAESLLAQIAGHLILFTEQSNGGSWKVTDVSVPGDFNDPSASQVWMNQAEKWMIITDGSTRLPIFFDGTSSRRSNGQSNIVGITADDFVPPAIGGVIQLKLTAPYTGQFNTSIILNGEYYEPTAFASGFYPAILTNISDSPGDTIDIGTSVNVIPQNYGVIISASVVQSGYIPVQNHLIMSVYPQSGRLPQLSPNYRGMPFMQWQKPDGSTVVFPIGNADTTVPFDGNLRTDTYDPPGYSGGFDTGTLLPEIGSVISYSASYKQGPTFSVGMVKQSFSAPASGSSMVIFLDSNYTGASNQVVWLNNQQYLISPAPSATSLTIINVINLSDTSGGGQYPTTVLAGAELLSVPELPPGRMGAYGMGREWLSLTDGISYIAGDIVGGPAGSVAENYRDSVLKTTENTFLAGGGTFRLPGTGDLITAMLFPPILDTSLGQGELLIGTPFSMFSNNSPVDRTTWQTLTSPLQTEALKDNGPLAQNSTILVNSDTFFRSYVGIGSLVMARRSFMGWGNKPISNEMQRILNNDNQSLLPYGSAITYDNRFLCTAAPNALVGGVLHIAMVTLNFDLISSLRSSQPPAWESAWTGINALQFLAGRVNGNKRAFAFTYNIDESIIELYELLPENTTSFDDNDVTPILWIFETPVLFNADIKPLPTLIQLADGEFYISDVKEQVTINVYYRPDFYPCWQLWNTQTVCVDENGQYAQAGYRMRLGLGEPDSDQAEFGNNRPLNIGNFFQFRVEITGSCKWHGLKVEASEFPQPEFALVDTPPECQAIDCQVPDDLRLYSLQGFPPQFSIPVPPTFPFYNEVVFFDNICSGDQIPTFTGLLPNWITVDGANNRLIGRAGVIGGNTQIEANANAQLVLNQFASAQIAAGNFSCASSLIILTDDELPTPGAVLPGHCQRLSVIGSDLYFCCYSGGLFVSTDALHWSVVIPQSTGAIYDVAFGNGLYVATTDSSAGVLHTYTSPDGLVWTKRDAFTIADSWGNSVAYLNGVFLMGDDSGNFFNSADGLSWSLTPSVNLYNTAIIRFLFVSGKYYAAVYNSGILTSTDGINWSNADDPGVVNMSDIAYGNGIFLAVTYQNVSGTFWTSTDGHTWTSHATGLSTLAVAFGGGEFTIVTRVTNKVWTSPDGINWTDSGRTANSGMEAVEFFNSRFVAAEG
jgi:hypothetical protein